MSLRQAVSGWTGCALFWTNATSIWQSSVEKWNEILYFLTTEPRHLEEELVSTQCLCKRVHFPLKQCRHNVPMEWTRKEKCQTSLRTRCLYVDCTLKNQQVLPVRCLKNVFKGSGPHKKQDISEEKEMENSNLHYTRKEQKKQTKKKYFLKKVKNMSECSHIIFPLSKPATSIHFPSPRVLRCTQIIQRQRWTLKLGANLESPVHLKCMSLSREPGRSQRDAKKRQQLAGVKPRTFCLKSETCIIQIFKTLAVNLINCAQSWPNTPHCSS